MQFIPGGNCMLFVVKAESMAKRNLHWQLAGTSVSKNLISTMDWSNKLKLKILGITPHIQIVLFNVFFWTLVL